MAEIHIPAGLMTDEEREMLFRIGDRIIAALADRHNALAFEDLTDKQRANDPTILLLDVADSALMHARSTLTRLGKITAGDQPSTSTGE